MPTPASTRLGLTAPWGNESLQQGDDTIRAMKDQLEAVVPSFTIVSTLPAPGIGGRFAYVSSTGIMYFDQGSRWRVVGGHTGQLSYTTRTNTPEGFLLCTGQPITTQYPELRALLTQEGNPYGVDGSGNPLLPSSPGRVLMAPGNGPGLTSRIRGQILGEETVRLTVEQMPLHTHNRGIGTNVAGDQPSPSFPYMAVKYTAVNPDRLDFGETSAAGGNGAHNNVQPSIVLNLMVQT